jgi:hypothetical protein
VAIKSDVRSNDQILDDTTVLRLEWPDWVKRDSRENNAPSCTCVLSLDSRNVLDLEAAFLTRCGHSVMHSRVFVMSEAAKVPNVCR